ncbi:hypothetical protein NIES806_14740 [Dolichospermum compactum NIES-806]|uniref:Uncharacterized protein n=1 Tax=Dolichospermum compactum NIES-806 TaxID=1973481 RepID=A0A1Z4V1F1_9CYAN|nr:hypothetical protein NIES806_14740 [Dolichospermum compactum NIES-806]
MTKKCANQESGSRGLGPAPCQESGGRTFFSYSLLTILSPVTYEAVGFGKEANLSK